MCGGKYAKWKGYQQDKEGKCERRQGRTNDGKQRDKQSTAGSRDEETKGKYAPIHKQPTEYRSARAETKSCAKRHTGSRERERRRKHCKEREKRTNIAVPGYFRESCPTESEVTNSAVVGSARDIETKTRVYGAVDCPQMHSLGECQWTGAKPAVIMAQLPSCRTVFSRRRKAGCVAARSKKR